MSLDLAGLAHQLAYLAERAAAAILDVYESDFAVEHKDDRSPLIAADLASHHIIVEGLGALTPDVPVLSEESAGIAWAARERWSRYWLVDPLDGTREFVKRNGEFTVNIALIEDHEPVLGIVQQPVGGELAAAWRGGGTWIGTPGAKARRVTTRRRGAPLVVAGSRSHASERETEILSRLGHHAKLPMGSSLKFLRIAAAEADFYMRLGPTAEWDTAAGQAVLEAAGGSVETVDGVPLLYGKVGVSDPHFIAFGGRG